MEKIIDAVSRDLLISELTEERFLRNTTKLNNQLYLTDAHNSPNVMLEIGRLRELAFRNSGGGTGKKADIDSYDTAENPFQQLVLWDPEDQEIIAGYRLIKSVNSPKDEHGRTISATGRLFNFSDRFYRDYLPYTMELGRSFIQPKYQRGASKKGLFSMDNLWDGLGAVTMLNPEIKYLFGKVTMYPSYNREARNILLAFMAHFFSDPDELVRPINTYVQYDELKPWFHLFEGLEYKDAYVVMNREVRSRGENIPPLINTYMGISGTMKTFGTALNDHFGQVEESGILITVADIYEARKSRHIQSFEDYRTYLGPVL